MILWSVVIGGCFGIALFALSGVGPELFGGGPRVVAHGHSVWRLLGLMQPIAGAVFALDGILIGAGDTRYLAWAMAAAFAVFCLWRSPRPISRRCGGRSTGCCSSAC